MNYQRLLTHILSLAIVSTFSFSGQVQAAGPELSKAETILRIEANTRQLAQLNAQITELRTNIGNYESGKKMGKLVRNVGVGISGVGLLGLVLSYKAFRNQSGGEYGNIAGGALYGIAGAVALGGGFIQAVGGEIYVIIEDRNLGKLDEALRLKQNEITEAQTNLNLLIQALK